MVSISPNDIRLIVGLTSSEAPDEEIEPYIEDAKRECLSDCCIFVKDEEITASEDNEKQYEVSHSYIADTNFDGEWDFNDVLVYGWVDKDDPSTRVELSVNSVDGRYGIVELTTAPSSYEKVTIDYWYYRDYADPYLMRKACAILASYKYVLAQFLLIPATLSHGALRYRFEIPYQNLYGEYERIKNLAFLEGSRIIRKTSSDSELEPMRGEIK